MVRHASNNVRRIRTKRRGRKQFNIQDLNAWEQAYGHQLTNTRRFQKVLPYVISITAFATLLFWNAFVSVITFIGAALFCWASILSKETYVSYIRASYSERNRIVNLLTQALSGGDATLFAALKQTTPSMQGELQHEFQILTGLLARSANQADIHDWFINEISKYRDDVIFGQYLEQLETLQEEGTYSVDTFLNLTRYHNDLYQKQLVYIQAKDGRKLEVFSIVAVVFVMLLVLSHVSMGGDSGSGWYSWVKIYAHSPGGMIASSIFLLIYAMIIRKFIKIYYDESITTYGTDRRAHSIRTNSRQKADRAMKAEADRQMITLTVNPQDRDRKQPLQRSTQAVNKTESHGFGNS